jgi:DNA-binding response OmpR family regulator
MHSYDSRDKIVALEDDLGIARVLECVIAGAGLKPLSAITCMDVQRHLNAGGVAALVADLMLSAHGCRGSDVALRSLATDPAIKILFVSGTAFDDWSTADRENVAALPEGCFDFLSKPFIGHVLLDKLTALLRLPAQPLTDRIYCPEYATCLDVSPPTLARIMAAPSRRPSWC